MLKVHPDGRILQQESLRGSNIGRITEPFTEFASAVAVDQHSILLEHMCERCMEIKNSTSLHFAVDAIKRKVTSTLTQNWYEYLVDNNPHNTLRNRRARVALSPVAESESHCVIINCYNLFTYEKGNTCCF